MGGREGGRERGREGKGKNERDDTLEFHKLYITYVKMNVY